MVALSPSFFHPSTTDRPKPLPLTLVRGDESEDGAIWRCGPAITDTSFPIQLYVHLNDTRTWGDHVMSPRWLAELVAVSPGFAHDQTIIGALQCVGMDEETLTGWSDAAFLALIDEALFDYGAKATLIGKPGQRASGPVRGAAVEAVAMALLIGITLDRRQNAIGNSGWDFMKGTIGFNHEPKQAVGLRTRHQIIIDRVNRLIPGRYEGED